MRLTTFQGPRGMACVVVIVAVVLSGCDVEEDVENHIGIALEDAPAEIAKAVCPRAYDCCTTAQLADNDQAGTDESSCEAKTTQGFRNHLATIQRSQKQGRVVYRGDRLAGCLAYVRSASCRDLNRTNHFSGLACEPYAEPKVPPGETCGHNFECVAGFCEKAPGAAQGACKAGQPPPPPVAVRGAAAVGGEMCFYSSACAFGAGRGRRSSAGLPLILGAVIGVACWRRLRRRSP